MSQENLPKHELVACVKGIVLRHNNGLVLPPNVSVENIDNVSWRVCCAPILHRFDPSQWSIYILEGNPKHRRCKVHVQHQSNIQGWRVKDKELAYLPNADLYKHHRSYAPTKISSLAEKIFLQQQWEREFTFWKNAPQFGVWVERIARMNVQPGNRLNMLKELLLLRDRNFDASINSYVSDYPSILMRGWLRENAKPNTLNILHWPLTKSSRQSHDDEGIYAIGWCTQDGAFHVNWVNTQWPGSIHLDWDPAVPKEEPDLYIRKNKRTKTEQALNSFDDMETQCYLEWLNAWDRTPSPSTVHPILAHNGPKFTSTTGSLHWSVVHRMLDLAHFLYVSSTTVNNSLNGLSILLSLHEDAVDSFSRLKCWTLREDCPIVIQEEDTYKIFGLMRQILSFSQPSESYTIPTDVGTAPE